MAKHVAGLLLAVLLCLPGLPAAAAELKIAVVSMERLFDEYHKTKEANARFKARADEMDIQRRELLANVKNLKKELDARAADARDKSLSDAERNKKQAEAEDKYNQTRQAEEKLLEFDKACKLQVGDQMRQLQQQFLVEIRGVIQAYIKERGITLVLDSSGKTLNNVEAVLIADKSFDITEPILALINQDAARAPAAATAPSNSTNSSKK